jgi:hypothetical protein
MFANGPAIKCVCVAERMQAGAQNPNRGRVLIPAGMSEAWRTFCRPGKSFLSDTSVAVQGCWRAGYKSWYTKFYRNHWRGRGTGIANLSWEQEHFAKSVTNK